MQVGLVCVSKEINSIFENTGHKCIVLKKQSFGVMKRFLRVKHEIASIVVNATTSRGGATP